MKKFKIDNVEIYANSIHDALEIYKTKVKDKSSFKQLATTLMRISYAFPDWPYIYFKTEEDRKIAKNYLDKKGIKYEEINDKNGPSLDLSHEYGRPIYGHDSNVKDDDVIYVADPLRMGGSIKEFANVDAVYKFQQKPESTGYHVYILPKSEYKSLKKMKNAEFAFNRLFQERKVKSFDSKVKDAKFLRFPPTVKSYQGYEVRGYCLTLEGRMYAVLYRPNTGDYLVAAGYNQGRGDWDQGYYDFKTEEQAIKKAEQLSKMYDSIDDSKVKDDWNYDFSDKIKDIQICIKIITDNMKKIESHPEAIDRIKHYLNNTKKYCDDAIALANQFDMK